MWEGWDSNGVTIAHLSLGDSGAMLPYIYFVFLSCPPEIHITQSPPDFTYKNSSVFCIKLGVRAGDTRLVMVAVVIIVRC